MFEATKKWFLGAPNREPSGLVPIVRPDVEAYSGPVAGIHLTWFGHSSVMLEIDGQRILTDPVWGERVSPSRFFGPKRFFAPPLELAELPKIDLVAISHDHYDHLDRQTVVSLAETGSNFVTPLGVGERLRSWGVSDHQITELDWWQDAWFGTLQLVCTPARHFSGRGLRDRNRTLWSGWAMIGAGAKVLYSGDSGMSPHFAEIGRRLGPFNLAMMDTGAYDSSWADVHMGPEQAVAAHHMVGGEVLLPVHWATFNLALHGWTEPGERVLSEARRTGTRLVMPRPGERLNLSDPPEATRWWPEIPWNTVEKSPIVSSAREDWRRPPSNNQRVPTNNASPQIS